MRVIDLRSDTVTKPTPAIREVMAAAEVGDDVYGDDPTVNRLESMAAERLGKQAALFVPSGTQANLLALLSHCQRGDEFIVGQTAHNYKYEGGGAAVVGGIQPQPLDFRDDGTLDLHKVAGVIKPDDIHFARTRLLCLENTMNGMVLPMGYIAEAAQLARFHKLKLHLDGARLFNAAIQLNVTVKEIAAEFDSVSICLSKGLGAPVGSLLCATQAQIKVARKWRKTLGGGMRQAGILAAAGIYVLDQHVERLRDDHANAERLARRLAKINAIDVRSAQTNMVFIQGEETMLQKLSEFAAAKGILISHAGDRIRLVTHLDISQEDIQTVIQTFDAFFQNRVS